MKTFKLATNIKKGSLKQMIRKNIEYGELDYNYKQNGFLFHDIDELRNFSNFNDDVEDSI